MTIYICYVKNARRNEMRSNQLTASQSVKTYKLTRSACLRIALLSAYIRIVSVNLQFLSSIVTRKSLTLFGINNVLKINDLVSLCFFAVVNPTIDCKLAI